MRVWDRNKQSHCRTHSMCSGSRLFSEERSVVLCCYLLYLYSVFPSFYFKIYLKRMFLSQIDFFFFVVWACISFSSSWKTENAILFNTETFRHDEHPKLVFGQGVYLQQQPCSTARVNCRANQFWLRGPDACDMQVFEGFT